MLYTAQPKFKLTKEMVEKAKPYSIIHQDQGYIEHPWFNNECENLESDGRSVLVKYVVYRGGIADWCIYHSLDANLEPGEYLGGKTHLEASYERVAMSGAKLHSDRTIKGLIDCDDETLKLYRH